MLRNGQTLAGKISRVGDFCYVAVPEGEIRLRAADVDLCCGSLEEAYQRKRAAIQIDDVSEHLHLAQWCQTQGLFGNAAAELADARKADPTQPLIAVLQQRLQMAMEPPPAKKATAADRPLSVEELDRMVRGLPPGSVELFTQSIQPLLINNCSTGGCHGPQSDKLRLLRIPSDGPPGRRLTQRNLHETLQWIDSQQPDDSRLLTAPLQPHGTARTAIFNDLHVAQYKRLVEWVHEVTALRAPEVPATVNRAGQMAAQAMPLDPGSLESPQPYVSRGAEASLRRKLQPAHTSRRPGSRDNNPAAQDEPNRAVPPPADPFDPEAFNRRFAEPSNAPDAPKDGK